MERTEELYEQIEQYLEGHLDAEALESFEKRLKEDVSLKEEVAKHRLVHGAMEKSKKLVFWQKIQTIGDEVVTEYKEEQARHMKTRRLRPYLAYAAVMTLLICGAWLFWNTTSSASDILFESYFEPFPTVDITRGGQEKRLEKSIHAYRNQNYEKVVQELPIYVKQHPEKTALSLYLVSSYLALGQGQKAIEVLGTPAAGVPNYEHQLWYLALAYLQKSDNQNTKKVLKRIIAYKGTHEKQAKELLDQLEE